ncbi:MAG: 30S ribosomal protein S17 [Candidatus Acidifodinimicrobium sp.]
MRYDDLVKPDVECRDKNCPYHGTLKVHGSRFEGVVVSAKSKRTAVVQWINFERLKKYDVYREKKTRVLAHNPDCISAKVNDRVVIYETRPLSRWKKFVIVRRL